MWPINDIFLAPFTSEKHVKISGEIFVNLESSSAPISSSIIQNNFSKLSHVSLVHPHANKMQFDFKSLKLFAVCVVTWASRCFFPLAKRVYAHSKTIAEVKLEDCIP